MHCNDFERSGIRYCDGGNGAVPPGTVEKIRVVIAFRAASNRDETDIWRGERDHFMFCGNGNNSCLWIIIILIILFCCGGWGCGNNCGNNNCGCDNNCGCC